VKAPKLSQGVGAVLSSHGDLSILGDLSNSGGRVHVGGDLLVTGKLFNENPGLRIERQTTSEEVSEVQFADERAPEQSYSADLVRFDVHG
ncbi:hypothetical protein, partial [Escherichia coli]|uniref:hypothetical protein n=1 Tax=Escherichia coli TaxID=562 RepID=UPI0028DF9B15